MPTNHGQQMQDTRKGGRAGMTTKKALPALLLDRLLDQVDPHRPPIDSSKLARVHGARLPHWRKSTETVVSRLVRSNEKVF